MKLSELLKPEQRHLLWKDEINDPFILTRFCEIYKYSDTELTVLFFKNTMPKRFSHIISHLNKTDEPLYGCRIKTENLPEILAISELKQRPNLRGKFIRDLEIRLGHKILPYRPSNLAVKGDGKFNKFKNIIKSENAP